MSRHKKIVIVLVLSFTCFLSACETTTLENLKDKESYVAAEDEIKESLSEKQSQSVQDEPSIYETQTFTLKDDDKIIHVVGLNDVCDYYDYEFSVEEVWQSDNLMLLDEIEGNSKFRDYMIFRNSDMLDEQGGYTGKNSGVKWLFIKVKIKNNGASFKLCMNPDFYNASGTGSDMVFTHISTIESMGFDKYKYISDRKQFRKDESYYYLYNNEEIETVIAFRTQGTMSDLYLGTKFLFRSASEEQSSTDPMDLPSESYMIRLNIIDGKVVK